MFKWLGKREPDYPQVLEQLDAKIRKTHLSLSNLQAKQRRVMFKALVYPGLVYLVGVVAYLAAPAASTSIGAAIRRALPLVVVPFAIYSFRVALGLWFSRCRNALVTDLAQMEQLQQNTVEELKQKTAYYQTKGLIERYDSPQRAAPHSVNGNIINPATETISKIPLTPKRQPLLARLSVESPIISAKPSPKSSSLQLQIPLQSPISLPSMHSENSQLLSPIPPTLEAPVISTWMDRLMDALLGPQESSHAKYALICESCFAHNGLSLPHEYMNAKFKCCAKGCGQMNDKSAAYRKYTFGMGQDFQPQALCKQNSASDLDLTGVADSPIRKNRKSKSSNNSSASIASNAKDIDSDFENPFLDRSHSNSQNVEPN